MWQAMPVSADWSADSALGPIVTAEHWGNEHLKPVRFAKAALGSGLIDYNQKMTMAAMQIADMKVWAHRS